MRLFIGVFLAFFSCVSLASDSSWWQLCDACQTDAQYAGAAFAAPSVHGIVYVTNRDTSETRKFRRFTTTEREASGGYLEIDHVLPESLSSKERDAFREAVLKARVAFANIPRRDLGGIVPGVGNASSVAIDLAAGRLSSQFVNALRLRIELAGFLPDHTSVNAEAGMSSPLAGANYGEGKTIRERDLVVVIRYDDGSTVSVTRRPDGSLVNWGVTDAEGNVIDMSPSNGNVIPVDGGSFEGPYTFGPGVGAIQGLEALIAEINSRYVTNCRMVDKGNGRVGVVCEVR